MHFRVKLFTFIVLTLPGAVSAQEAAPPLTVDEAVRRAVSQNPRLTAVAREIAAAEAGVKSAQVLTNPSVVLTPAITRGGSDEELLLQQPLELNGTRSARTGVARAQLRQTRAEAVAELRSLVFQTKQAYIELARRRELLALSRELLRFAETTDQQTRRQVEVGSRPGIDQTQTAVEAARARQAVTRAEAEARAAEAALQTLMGIPAGQPVAMLAALPAPESPPLDVESAVQQALQQRTEIDAEEAAGEAFRQQARLARAQGRPDVAPQLRAENLLRDGRQVGVGVGITLPFLDYGSRRSRIRQAEQAAQAQEARAEAARLQVRQEVEQAAARLTAAASIAQDYRNGVLDRARRLLEGSQTGFQTGLTNIVALLQAQRTYREVLAEYTNALADYALAAAELERATGRVSATLAPLKTEARGNR